MRPASGARRLVLLGACVLAWPAVLSAQTQSTAGDLAGRVIDGSGAAVPGVSIAVVHEQTGFRRTATAGTDGRYAVQALPIGTYRLEARAAGFAPLDVHDVTLMLGTTTVVDLVLQVAGVSYDVMVTGSRALDDAQQPGQGLVIDSAEFGALPVNVRNYLAFSLLTPTSAPDRTPQQGASRTSGLTFAGQHARSNSIVVDGMDNNDETVGSVRAVFSQDAVQQFQVLASGYSAEYGKASGGVVNIVTRSGTNTVAGSAFVYGRDASLNARNYFERFNPAGQPIDVEKAPYDHLQYGGVLGGPLKRDRTFLFGSVERLSANASNFVTIDDRTVVPGPVPASQPLGTVVDILGRAGFPVETGHVPFRLRSTQWLAKLDHHVGANGRLSLRVNGASELNENIEPFGGLIARSRGASLDNRDVMAGLSHSLVAGTRLVNELRLLVASRDQDVRALDPACDGECDREDEGGPTLEVAGVASVGRQRFTPTPRDNRRWQVVDTLAYATGDHLLKTGVDFSVIDGRRQALPLHFGGRYIFTALPAIPGLLPAPISSIQAVALGLPAAYVQGYGNSGAAYDVGDVAFFVEDLWRPAPRLSIRAGLRYQRQFWPDHRYNTPGVPDSYAFRSDGNDFAPRVAVTWSPVADGGVLRAGYGIYYDQTITAVAGITQTVSGTPESLRTLVLAAPRAFVAWASPGRRLSEAAATALAGGSYPSVTIPIDPGFRTGHAHHAFAGWEQRIGRVGTVSATAVLARGFDRLGTIDYNPVVPALGAGRRPLDVNGVAGTSASVLQYTSFGETWYRALSVSLESAPKPGTAVRLSYTWSKAEDTTTDFQSAFLPQNNGRGRDPAEPEGLPLGFRGSDERGAAPSDQRHRLVASAVTRLPGQVHVSGLLSAASGWPFNVLAGVDLNGDRDGGSFPSDRARRVPADPATSLSRNSDRLPSQVSLDLRVSRPIVAGPLEIEPLVEIFNVFNRTNFVEAQNVFGAGPYPAQPSATFGQFTQAGPARQVQLAVRVRF
jgi:hypothetical protein